MASARNRLLRTLAALPLAATAGVAPAQAHVVCTLIADLATGHARVRDGDCDARVTPASTFKIAISLMGYDAGVLLDEHAPALPFRDGYAAWRPEWRVTTDPAAWMQHSVVWFSQQTTLALGEARFRRYVAAFRYGNGDLSGDRAAGNGLTHAWLSSSLRISPGEQVGFLRRMLLRQLPVSPQACDLTARIVPSATLADGWSVHGKTGTGAPVGADGALDEVHSYGWFVGWAVRGREAVVFARLTQDDRPEPTPAGPRTRDALLAEFPVLLERR